MPAFNPKKLLRESPKAKPKKKIDKASSKNEGGLDSYDWAAENAAQLRRRAASSKYALRKGGK